MANRKVKSRLSSLIESRKIVSSEHLNPNGTLFGGYLMCWIDEVAFMCARKFSGRPTCVTANIDNITFNKPHFPGDHLMLRATVSAVGRTSMQIEAVVFSENPFTNETKKSNSAHLTFVCLDESLRPVEVPDLLLETTEDHLNHQEAILRLKVRKRISRFLAKQLEKQGNYAARVGESLSEHSPKSGRRPFLLERVLARTHLVDSDRLNRSKNYQKLRNAVLQII